MRSRRKSVSRFTREGRAIFFRVGGGGGVVCTLGFFFKGNGRAIFLGLVVGAALICTIGFFYKRQQAARQRAEEERRMVAVTTQSVSRPEPIVIQISADLIHVTAI